MEIKSHWKPEPVGSFLHLLQKLLFFFFFNLLSPKVLLCNRGSVIHLPTSPSAAHPYPLLPHLAFLHVLLSQTSKSSHHPGQLSTDFFDHAALSVHDDWVSISLYMYVFNEALYTSMALLVLHTSYKTFKRRKFNYKISRTYQLQF